MLVMLDFLNEIRATGKITRAAERAQVSYRHAWNLIEKWSEFFGTPLVERRQGRGTVLTTSANGWCGLASACRRACGPHAAEPGAGTGERDQCAAARGRRGGAHPRQPWVRGFGVARPAGRAKPDLRVDFRYVGNVNAPASLAHGECELAGMHLPQGELRAHSVAAWRDVLSADRPPRDPLREARDGTDRAQGQSARHRTRLQDLLRRSVRFVNRDPESGTRVLFDDLLAQHGIDGARIQGYQQVEFTHCGGGGLRGQRHGRCQLRRGSGGAAVRPGFRAGGHRGLCLRVPSLQPREARACNASSR